VLAVLAADRDRPLLAGALLGLAVANKEWAVLAALPVLLALPAGRRLRCSACALAFAAAVLAPLLLAHGSRFAQSTSEVASSASVIFQPWQVWWFLGHHGALVHGLNGNPKPGYRQAALWAGSISHPAVVLVGVGAILPLWLTGARQRIRGGGTRGIVRALAGPERALPLSRALLALSLALLLRCLLDTWDNVYYPLPFLLALLAWETSRGSTQPPVMALAATVLVWLSFEYLPGRVSPDAQAALFLAWAAPLAVALAASLYGLGGRAQRRAAADGRSQVTTVSSLGRLVSTPLPFPPTTTRSSIRTPSTPGR
jgi:hypothetical protein